MFRKRLFVSAIFALTVLLLTACMNAATPADSLQTEDAESNATVVPETEPTEQLATKEEATEEVPTEVAVFEEPTPEPLEESTDWTETATVDGDYFVLGNPAAPIRLVDYSDFM